jgi:predicted nucleic acid-binding protein
MITVKSKIEKGSIRLPKRVKLPEGTQVIVRIEPIQKAKAKQKIIFDVECAKVFGTVKSKLRSQGKPAGEVDALIAATAIAHEATFVTSNEKHFENIEGLRFEVWPMG